MKRLLLLVCVALVSCVSFAQTRAELYSMYEKASAERDSVAWSSVISTWEKLYPHDSELYAVKVNYYVNYSMKDGMVINDTPPAPGAKYYEMKDENGNKLYLYSEFKVVNEALYQLAIKTFNEAIRKYPDRLDFRAGMTHVCLTLKQSEQAVQQILSIIERSAKNDNKWTWTLDEAADSDGFMFMNQILCDYIFQLFNAGESAYAEEIVDKALSVYPKDAVFMNSKGAIRYSLGDTKAGQEWYLKAYQVAPNDKVVISNVADSYYKQGDKENALKYYRILAQCDDEQYAQHANAMIQTITAE